MPTIITVCDTCKRENWSEETDERTHGEDLLQHVNEAVKSEPDLLVRRQSCLMGCAFGCNITIQSAGKISYVLGAFEPDAQSAEAIVDYARKYNESETGQVPYRTWPEGVKGHFRARVYPDP